MREDSPMNPWAGAGQRNAPAIDRRHVGEEEELEDLHGSLSLMTRLSLPTPPTPAYTPRPVAAPS